MSDREAFRKNIEEYLNAGRINRGQFADQLGYTREHVSRILHGKAKMPEDFVHGVVRTLAELRCIHGRGQARKLLQSMDALDFSLDDWKAEPLAILDDTASSDLTVVSEVSIFQQEVVHKTDESTSFPLWTVPYLRNPFFTGREDLLDQLHQKLTDTKTTRRAALTQPQAIKGLGGIGKTQIAVEYAYRSRDLYACIFWLNAATEEALISSFAKIAEALPSFAAKNETDQRKLVQAIKRWLEQFEQRWLLIFDNVEDIPGLHEYLPQRGNGSILLTTRTHAPGSLAASIEVEKMGWMEGTELLLRRAQRFDRVSDEERNEAGNIVIALDHFPLALDQAGAYIEETGCGLVDYLQVYKDHRKELLAQRGNQAANYPDSVATTWSLSFRKIAQANPAAAELLQLCAFLAPDSIPEELITNGAANWSPLLQQAATDPITFNQMIAELLKYSLVKRLVETHTLSIHRLVQAVQIDAMELDVQYDFAVKTVLAVNNLFPLTVSDVATWPTCLRYLDQAQACDTLIRQHTLMLAEAADLLHRIGLYLVIHASYTIAEPLYIRALCIREQQLGPEHPGVAQSVDSLANLYQHQGKYEQAEPLYKRALSISEQQLGLEHSDTAASVNNLANLYYVQGKYEQAEPLYRRGLSIFEQKLGLEHPNTATSLHNLAHLYMDQGKHEQAKLLFERALTIREQQLGPEHPDTVTSLGSLASLYCIQGKYEQAESLYQQALCIREQQLGPEHPDTAAGLNNLAHLYYVQGKHEQAKPLFERALTIRERQLGPEHPDTATGLNNLANLYYVQGKYGQAEPLFEQALSVSKQKLGLEHPDTATSLNNLALLYARQGKYEQAEIFYKGALAISEQRLGPEHHETVICLDNLRLFYWNQGKYEQAEPLFERALTISERQLGPEHPKTVARLLNLAELYWDQGKHEQAEPLFERALAISERQLGPEHPTTVSILGSFAIFYWDQGKYEQAEPLFEQTISMCERQLGPEHPKTVSNLNSLATLYYTQGKYEQAEPLYQQILWIYEQGSGPNDTRLAEILHDFATLKDAQGNHKEAKSLYERALTIRIQALGQAHPQTKATSERLQVMSEELDKAEKVIPLETVQREQTQMEKEQQ